MGAATSRDCVSSLRAVQDGDDEFDDDASYRDPLHPDDRLWRHPSEMASVPAPGSRSIPDTVDFAPVPAHRRGRGGWTIAVASGLVGASAVLLVVLATGMTDRVVERGDPAIDDAIVASTVPVSTSTLNGTSEAINAVMPSVAQIAATTGDEIVDGSAIVVRADGYLLTDAHLLDGATSLQVTLSDGTTLPAELVAIDAVTALAVVHVERTDLIPAQVGDPASLQVGQLTMALGSQGGAPSISSGVISAFEERSITISGTYLYGLIRFDAPLPDGAAGGPLITETGEVIGVTIKPELGASFSWATPIDDATDVAAELIADGRVKHPWLGVQGRRTAEGAGVEVVMANSPAEAAGIEVDDVLLSIDGKPLPSMAALVAIIRDYDPGDVITITYLRDGIEWTCVATLGLSG